MSNLKRWYPWIIVAFSFLLYVNTIGHDYALDDAVVLTDNMFTQEGISGLKGIFTKDSFYGFFKVEGKDKLVAGGRYRPLSLAVFAMEVEIFGLTPFVSHGINILLYSGLCLLVFFFTRQLVQYRINHGDFLAFLVSILFAFHPIHTEVVANIKGRDELLAMGLAFLGAHLLLRRHGWRTGFLAGSVFLLALLSKEHIVAMAAIVPMIFYYFRGLSIRSAIAASWPVYIAIAVFLLIWFSVLGMNRPTPPMELMNNPFLKIQNGLYVPFSFSEQAGTILLVLGMYLKLLFFPHPLIHDYYPRQIEIFNLSDPIVIVSALINLALLIYAIMGIKGRRLSSFAILYYFATLFIYTNILFPIGTNLSERFLFMPSFGFCLLIGWFVYQLHNKRKEVSMGVLGVIMLLYGLKTVSRNRVWKDNFTLFTTDVKVADRSAKLRNATAGILLEGAAAQKNISDDELRSIATRAIDHLRVAIDIHPNYKNAHLLLGNAYFYVKDYDRAIQFYKNALRLDPNYRDAEKNLFIAYRNGGKYFGETRGDLNKSLEFLHEAYALNSKDYELLRLLGVAYGVKSIHQEAVRYFKEATKVEPDKAEAWSNLGKAAYNAGKIDEANQYFERARRINPEALK